MRLLCRNILIVSFVLIQAFCFGHNPLSARYHLESNDKVSLLTINLSQDGVNSALYKVHNKEDIAALSRAEFEELIVDYIKSNFSLNIDGEVIRLNEGGIKYGSHQTDLKFVLPPLPSAFKEMVVDISAFKENENHQTIFSYSIQGLKDRAILKSKNDYRANFVKGDKLDSSQQMSISLVGFLILLSALLSFLFYRNKNIAAAVD
ncbi:hypothetical protein N9L92_04235 [Saprospiraceae bacterium]|nr:hypothetical protein [Saprospiraceae bacterium]